MIHHQPISYNDYNDYKDYSRSSPTHPIESSPNFFPFAASPWRTATPSARSPPWAPPPRSSSPAAGTAASALRTRGSRRRYPGRNCGLGCFQMMYGYRQIDSIDRSKYIIYIYIFIFKSILIFKSKSISIFKCVFICLSIYLNHMIVQC